MDRTRLPDFVFDVMPFYNPLLSDLGLEVREGVAGGLGRSLMKAMGRRIIKA